MLYYCHIELFTTKKHDLQQGQCTLKTHFRAFTKRVNTMCFGKGKRTDAQ